MIIEPVNPNRAVDIINARTKAQQIIDLAAARDLEEETALGVHLGKIAPTTPNS